VSSKVCFALHPLRVVSRQSLVCSSGIRKREETSVQTDAERMQRRSLPSQPRQCGLLTLRMFWLPYCGGPSMPQRAMTMLSNREWNSVRERGRTSPRFPFEWTPRQTPARRRRDRHSAVARGFANEGLRHSFPVIVRDQAGDADSIQERVADRVKSPCLEREINDHVFDFQISRTSRGPPFTRLMAIFPTRSRRFRASILASWLTPHCFKTSAGGVTHVDFENSTR
jgi:hypothetical protein